VLPAVQGDYTLASGRDVSAPAELVANSDLLRATGLEIGDTISLAAGYNPLLRAATRTGRFAITGTANFLYLSAAQPALAIMLPELQKIAGEGMAGSDRVSLLMVRAREGANLDSLEQWMAAAAPAVEVISTRKALQTVDERLEYFKQIALILGAVSLAVGFLLVTTLMTVSVNERIGEIAVQRAIGITRGGVIAQIVLEGIAISVAGAVLGLALGLVTARYLNSILSSFPGLPAAIDFFPFQPASAWRALGMLVAAGILGGIYPAWRAGSLGIARTLREEAVA
jgi:putative ABC transport system permease protein